jgi:hypothetical protein
MYINVALIHENRCWIFIGRTSRAVRIRVVDNLVLWHDHRMGMLHSILRIGLEPLAAAYRV